MDWRGIDWLVPLLEVAMILVPVYAFVRLYRLVRYGGMKKASALWRYAALTASPILLFVLVFAALVGLEELTQISVVTEDFARSFLILAGLGCAVWMASTIVFGSTLGFVKSKRTSSEEDQDSDA